MLFINTLIENNGKGDSISFIKTVFEILVKQKGSNASVYLT